MFRNTGPTYITFAVIGRARLFLDALEKTADVQGDGKFVTDNRRRAGF